MGNPEESYLENMKSELLCHRLNRRHLPAASYALQNDGKLQLVLRSALGERSVDQIAELSQRIGLRVC